MVKATPAKGLFLGGRGEKGERGPISSYDTYGNHGSLVVFQ